MKILKPALMYFGLVFGTGFLLGIVRALHALAGRFRLGKVSDGWHRVKREWS